MCLARGMQTGTILSVILICHPSSGVEHFHGKEGVSGSNPEGGSKRIITLASSEGFSFFYIIHSFVGVTIKLVKF